MRIRRWLFLVVAPLASSCQLQAQYFSPPLVEVTDCKDDSTCEQWVEETLRRISFEPPRAYERAERRLIALTRDEDRFAVLHLISETSEILTYQICSERGGCNSGIELLGTEWPEIRLAFDRMFEAGSPDTEIHPDTYPISSHESPLLIKRCSARQRPICDAFFFNRGGSVIRRLIYMLQSAATGRQR